MKPQNKTLNKQSPKLLHVDNFEQYISVTSSTHNITINHKEIRIPLRTETKMSANEWNKMVNKDAFALMPNKSLSNRYAVAGLHTDINLSRQNSAVT